MPELELVLYTTSFCGACAATRERIQAVTKAVGSRVTWREVNVAFAPDDAERAGIGATPTVVLNRHERGEVMRAQGVPTIEQLLTAIATNID